MMIQIANWWNHCDLRRWLWPNFIAHPRSMIFKPIPNQKTSFDHWFILDSVENYTDYWYYRDGKIMDNDPDEIGDSDSD